MLRDYCETGAGNRNADGAVAANMSPYYTVANSSAYHLWSRMDPRLRHGGCDHVDLPTSDRIDPGSIDTSMPGMVRILHTCANYFD